MRERGLSDERGRRRLVERIAVRTLDQLDLSDTDAISERIKRLLARIFDYEEMFRLPRIDWTERRSTTEWWSLRDQLNAQRTLVDEFDATEDLIVLTVHVCASSLIEHCPTLTRGAPSEDDIVVETELKRSIGNPGALVDTLAGVFFDKELIRAELFPRLRDRLERNLVAASGGNPADPRGFNRVPKLPSQSGIRDTDELVSTYLGGTPVADLLSGRLPFAIPHRTRFEHHHIVGGSGHGKTQTLQYLIAEDLEAVARGERSVVVLDSQGDLIRTIANLKVFAPGKPLHERVVIIDPTDVEYPVSLNLFDVGLERLDRYSPLDRERLVNSILELYDFVLGSLLSAEMTQKQNVIFRYVTRLMLQIPDATIHTLRELMETGSEVRFAEHIAKLQGTARHFFETEFPSREFEQTRKQVLRRLWGILENQTFERMFSHPRSKLDLYSEMNAGKVILINTAKDLLKETGTEIFGRFFIALIAQAAQERATLPERKRMPTFVYVDEAADYFDRNIGIILSQARKYNVGMVLAHQYLGQLEPKLLDAIAANTSIKFAGGVSAKDARALAPMMACDPAFIDEQPKGSFAAYVRGATKMALPLRFSFGRMEEMERMSEEEREALQDAMRRRYAVHYKTLTEASPAPWGQEDQSSSEIAETSDGDAATDASPTW